MGIVKDKVVGWSDKGENEEQGLCGSIREDCRKKLEI